MKARRAFIEQKKGLVNAKFEKDETKKIYKKTANIYISSTENTSSIQNTGNY